MRLLRRRKKEPDSFWCETLVENANAARVRSVEIAAPPELVFRWLCQLRVAATVKRICSRTSATLTRSVRVLCLEVLASIFQRSKERAGVLHKLGQQTYRLTNFGYDGHRASLTHRPYPLGT